MLREGAQRTEGVIIAPIMTPIRERSTLPPINCLNQDEGRLYLHPFSILPACRFIVFLFNARRNFSATMRSDLRRAKYLLLASTNVQGAAGVLVFNSISSAAIM